MFEKFYYLSSEDISASHNNCGEIVYNTFDVAAKAYEVNVF